MLTVWPNDKRIANDLYCKSNIIVFTSFDRLTAVKFGQIASVQVLL